jgi:peptidoglycan/LPS O-acetylase OafA/YrhL
MNPASTASPREWADRLGTWTSALCVVHCLLTPVLLSFSAVAAHFLPAEESVHRSLALLVALFGTIALVVGFRKHRRALVLLLMLLGLGCIAGAAWFGDMLPSHAMEVMITFCGSGFMIAAHRLNHTFCKSCECSSKCKPTLY